VTKFDPYAGAAGGAWTGGSDSRPAGRPPTGAGRAAPSHPSGGGAAGTPSSGFGFSGRTRAPSPAAGGSGPRD